MRKPVIAALLLASAASGVVYAQSTRPIATTTPAAAGKPQLGSFGVDLTAMDKSVAPGDDFYNYVNGAWMARTEIPADRSSWGGFAILRNLSDERTRKVIEDAAANPGSDPVTAKIGDTYASFMDAAAIEKAGATPLKPYLAKIAAINSQTDLARAFGDATRHGIDVPIGAGVQQDLKDNTVYAVYVGQGGLGLPDKDYYLKDDPKFAEARTKYVTYIADMMRMAGQPDPQGAAQRIYDLEKQIAQVHWDRAELRQVEKGYNPMPVAHLATAMPGFDWKAMLDAQGLGNQSRVIVGQPSAQAGTAKIVAATPLPVWKEYLAFHTISNAAPLLSSNFVNTQFAFYGTTLNGTPQLKDRWKRGVDLVNGSLGEAVGQVYVQKYFPPESKAKADELVRNLISAMDKRLNNLTWMAPETKLKARAKLAAFTPKIGYPDKFRDYTSLKVVKGDVLGNADPAVNYGAIGAVIGHELSHHFDDQGRKFDPKGNFSDWWTPQDVARFNALTDKVVAQYGAYEPIPGTHVNGKLTLGENMADLAGINVAYDAYKLSLKGKPAPVIDGYTGDQRFFMGFGQVWQTKAREASIKNQLTTDPHTPGQWRAYVVRNLDAWYPAFNVKPGQKFYLAPADRIKIW